MSKKSDKKPTKKELLSISQLAKVLGIRYSTISYYSKIGILPFEQAGEGLWRYYNKKEVLKRFKEIQRLKKKKLTMKEIIDHFKNKKEENAPKNAPKREVKNPR